MDWYKYYGMCLEQFFTAVRRTILLCKRWGVALRYVRLDLLLRNFLRLSYLLALLVHFNYDENHVWFLPIVLRKCRLKNNIERALIKFRNGKYLNK